MGCNSSSNLTPAQKRRLESKKKGSTSTPTVLNEIDPLKLIAKLEVPILLGSDFKIDYYVASGGGKTLFSFFFFFFRSFTHSLILCSFNKEGRVFAANHTTINKQVALKFFGYETKVPELDNILNEIHILKALAGIDGIVNFDGIFMDTVTGIVSGKKHRKPFPVIVMEILSGGELFDRIQVNGEMNEALLSNVFRHVIQTMQEMHNRCYIHR